MSTANNTSYSPSGHNDYLWCVMCDKDIVRDSDDHDHCVLVNKGYDLICQDCPRKCKTECGECVVCEDPSESESDPNTTTLNNINKSCSVCCQDIVSQKKTCTVHLEPEISTCHCYKCDEPVPLLYLHGKNDPLDETWVCCAHTGWYCPCHSQTSNCGDMECVGCNPAGESRGMRWWKM